MAKEKGKLFCTFCGTQLVEAGTAWSAQYGLYTGKKHGPYIILKCPEKGKWNWNPLKNHDDIFHDELWVTKTKSGAYHIEAM